MRRSNPMSRKRVMAAGLLPALLLFGRSLPGQVFKDVWAARAERTEAPAWFPAGAVLTNLHSPTGRVAFLLLRATPEADILARAQRMAQDIGATAQARASGDLWVVMIQHQTQRISARRLGRELRLGAVPPTPLSPALSKIIGLSGVRAEADYDQELLLRAKNRFRDAEHAPPELVSLAQGGAARSFLRLILAGDDLRATLFGQRHSPLLMAHPDSPLLLELLRTADQHLDLELPALPLAPTMTSAGIHNGPPAPTMTVLAVPAWSQTMAKAAIIFQRARARLALTPQHEEARP